MLNKYCGKYKKVRIELELEPVNQNEEKDKKAKKEPEALFYKDSGGLRSASVGAKRGPLDLSTPAKESK